MIEVKNIVFAHKHQNDPILKGVSFVAKSGDLTTILGPNGSGKTTLFKCLAGIWRHQEGEILFQNKNVSFLEHRERAKVISVVPQEHEPPFPYSVFDVVLMGRAAHIGVFSLPKKSDYDKAKEALEIVGISHLSDKPYTNISGGERQLVLIARAIAQDAPIMLFDEPTSHLDFKNQVLVLKKVKQIIKERQVIAIMTIHDPNLAMLFSDHMVMINRGTVVEEGEPKTVMSEKKLERLYGIEVELYHFKGKKIVVPKITGE